MMIEDIRRGSAEHIERLEERVEVLTEHNVARIKRITELETQISKLLIERHDSLLNRQKLEAENAELRTANGSFDTRQMWWNERMFVLEQEVDALRSDAERYRWMRREVKRIPPGWGMIGWDKAIDAARGVA